jgi:hypothetical protein
MYIVLKSLIEKGDSQLNETSVLWVDERKLGAIKCGLGAGDGGVLHGHVAVH